MTTPKYIKIGLILFILTCAAIAAFSQRIEAEAYTEQSGTGLETGSEGVDVGYIDAGDWLEYSIPAGQYKIDFRVSSPNGNCRFTIAGVSVTVPKTGGWQTYTTVSVTVTVPGGTVRLLSQSYGWNFNWMQLTASNPPPTAFAGNDTTINFPDRYILRGSGGMTRKWSLLSVSIPMADTAITGVVDSTVYTYRLTVTDTQGRTATDDIRIVYRYNANGEFLRLNTGKEFLVILNDGTLGVGGFFK